MSYSIIRLQWVWKNVNKKWFKKKVWKLGEDWDSADEADKTLWLKWDFDFRLTCLALWGRCMSYSVENTWRSMWITKVSGRSPSHSKGKKAYFCSYWSNFLLDICLSKIGINWDFWRFWAILSKSFWCETIKLDLQVLYIRGTFRCVSSIAIFSGPFLTPNGVKIGAKIREKKSVFHLVCKGFHWIHMEFVFKLTRNTFRSV